MITSPLTSVLLSYSAKISHVPRKQYIIYSFSVGFICCIGYFFCRLISNPLILLLYPDYLIPAQEFIPITIMISMLEVYYSFIWPLIFRFGKTSYPLLIVSIKAIIYISFSILLVKTYNVMAICYAGFISSLIQALIIFVLGIRLSTRG
jgi:O-antigen/teichoic acid export membrane protein